jgi:hypothetical protein
VAVQRALRPEGLEIAFDGVMRRARFFSQAL